MANQLTHRGPDGYGTYHLPYLFLGARRLAIIDREGGHQPVFNENRTVIAVFNGEIYNYRDLRKSISRAGHLLHGQSDTEIIVHLYEEQGPAFVRELDGMFSIALWDSERQLLLLARDRLGIKPLYYLLIGKDIFFASELKAIRATGLIDNGLNLQAIDDYLSLSYVPGPNTIYRDIVELPPSNRLECRDDSYNLSRYWSLSFGRDRPLSLHEDVDVLKYSLQNSVKLALNSDRPLGLMLSGGIDSGAILALAQNNGIDVPTYTASFNDDAHDEYDQARSISEWVGSRHRRVNISEDDFVKYLPKVAWHLDQPNGDPNALAIYLIASVAFHDGLAVLISGEGSDELFAGYPYYLSTLERYQEWRSPKEFARRFPLAQTSAARQVTNWFVSMTDWNSLEVKRRIYRKDILEELNLNHYLQTMETVANIDPGDSQRLLDQMLRIDLLTWLPGALLSKSDRMTMAHSIELRVPFLTPSFVDTALSLPPTARIYRRQLKYLLKQSLKTIIPIDYLRSHKQGFVIPLTAWLRKGRLSEFAGDILHSAQIRDFTLFSPKAVDELWSEHYMQDADHSQLLWNLLIFTIWRSVYSKATISQ